MHLHTVLVHAAPYVAGFIGLVFNNRARASQLRGHAQKLNRDAMLREKAREMEAAK